MSWVRAIIESGYIPFLGKPSDETVANHKALNATVSNPPIPNTNQINFQYISPFQVVLYIDELSEGNYDKLRVSIEEMMNKNFIIDDLKTKSAIQIWADEPCMKEIFGEMKAATSGSAFPVQTISFDDLKNGAENCLENQRSFSPPRRKRSK